MIYANERMATEGGIKMATKWLKERLRRLEIANNQNKDVKFFIAYHNKDGTLTYDGEVLTESQFSKCHEGIDENKFVIIL